MEVLSRELLSMIVWGIICVMSCYGLVWFFRHARDWAGEGTTSPGADSSAHPHGPRPHIEAYAVFIAFALWLCVGVGFMNFVYESVKFSSPTLALGPGYEMTVPSELTGNVFLQIFVNLIGQLLLVGLLLPLATTVPGLPESLGLDRVPTRRHLMALAFLWLLFLVPIFTVEQLWSQVLQWVGHRPFLQTALKAYGGAVQQGDYLMVFAVVSSAVGLAPVVEELLYRGYLHNLLSSRGGVLVGTFCSALLFAAVHIVPSVLFPIFVLGCLLSLIFEWRRSVWDCIVFHAYFNAGSLALAIIFMYWSGQPM